MAWCLRFGPLFPVPPPPLPPWLSPGVFWSSQSGCICNGPVVSYLWYGASWLIGSCLHSAPWQQRLRPCVGLCPLHHVVGVVHVSLAPSLRYSPSCDPVYPSDTAKAARARLLGLCCFLPCPAAFPGVCSLLPCWSPLVSFSPRPRFVGLCLPALWSFVLAGACGSSFCVCVFGLSSWRGLFCGLFGLFGFVVLFVPGWFLCFVFCFWWLLLTSYWTGTLVYFDFTCTTKAFTNWTGVSVCRLDRFTCAVDFTGSPCLCFGGIV